MYPPNDDEQDPEPEDGVVYTHPDGSTEVFPPGTTPQQLAEALNAHGTPIKFSPIDLSRKTRKATAGTDVPAKPPTAATSAASAAPAGPAGPQDKSVGGFLGNVVTSTANQFGNIAQAITSPVQTLKGAGSVIRGGVEKLIPGQQEYEKYADAFGQMYKDRYGSLDKLGETAYTDPAGVALDVAGLAGGAGLGLRGVGTLANLPRVAKVGQVLSAVEAATSPTRLITLPAKAALRQTGKLAIMPTTRPSANTRRSFNVTPQQVAGTIIDRAMLTKGGATRAQKASEAAVDAALTKARAAGNPGLASVPIGRRVVSEITPEIRGRTAATGEVSTLPELQDRIWRFYGEHPTGRIDLLDANELKRKAQGLAYESGQKVETIPKLTQDSFARAFKEGIEEQVPSVKGDNRQSQLAIAAEHAIEDASNRVSDIPKLTAAAKLLSGDLPGAIAAYFGTLAATAPVTGRALGITLGQGGRAIDSRSLARVAMMRALAEQGTPDTSR